MNINKILSWSIVFVIIVIAGGFAWHWYYERIDVDQFIGVIEQKGANTLTVKGKYYTLDHPELQNADQERTVTVIIGPATRLVKTAIQLPKTNELFNTADLPHTTTSASFDSFMIGQQITVNVVNNIYHRTSFTAGSIEYLVLVPPGK